MSDKMSPQERAELTVAVIGAGIGGVSIAWFLHKAGFTVDLYDQAPAFLEVGGTIGIDNQSIDVLREWDAHQAVLDTAAPSVGMELRTMQGELQHFLKIPDLTDMGVKVEGRTGMRETFGIQRSDLHGTILSYFPVDRTHANMRLTSVADKGTHAEAIFEDGTVIRPRILIGADGIRSTVRKLFTDVEAPFANVTICRSLALASALPEGWANDRGRRWEHPLPDGSSVNAITGPTRRGTHVGIDTSIYMGDQLLDLPDNVVPLDRLLSLYPDDTDPALINLIKSNLVVTRSYPLYDLPEIHTWSSDCVTLLGDSAHAMRPLLGQGANQAIQDAGELARQLVDNPDPSVALKAYEQIREPFTNAIKRAAKQFVPQYAKVFAAGKQD
ncbi:FAD-dependent oxidoreductase [Nocardioides sp. GCM10030258]|uniref:FAD-dependent oxidoreductase n=1 Tax=unclassified Nocardioides TaxID=2615069 RepID=UPI0036175C12